MTNCENTKASKEQRSPLTVAVSRQEISRTEHYRNQEQALCLPRFKSNGDNIEFEGDERLAQANLAATLATPDQMLAIHLGNQIARVTAVESDYADALNKGLSLTNAIGPKDPLEAMLATQMAASHDLAMKFMSWAANETSPRQIASYADLATKFNRTFVAQMELLGRHRNRGQQKVVVEHQYVTVNDGGQAIVGVAQHLSNAGEGKGV